VGLFTPAGSLLSAEPLVTDDNSMHAFYSLLGSRLISQTGQPNGYVPSEMGGHPKTPLYDAGIVPVERAMATFSFLPPFAVYKLFVVLSIAAVALGALLSLWLLGLRGVGLAGGWTLILFHYWWGQGADFTMGGMNTWLLGASLCLLLVCATARLIERWTWPLAGGAAALMCVAPWVHPIAILGVVLAAGSLVVLRAGDRRRTLLFVTAVGILALALNAGWMWQTHSHGKIGTPRAEVFGSAVSPLSIGRTAWTDIVASPSRIKTLNRVAVAAFDLWLTGLGLVGLIELRRRRDRRFWVLLPPVLVFAFLTFFSQPFPALQNMLPARLRFLWLTIVSALAALVCARWWQVGGARRVLAAGTGLLGCAYFLAFDARPDVSRLQVGFDPVQQQWIAAINAMADDRARVLVEDGRGYREMGPVALQLATHTQWIGGPYRAAYIQYHAVNFLSGKLSGRPIGDYGADELGAFLRRYNVHWILAWSAEAKQALSARAALVTPLREIAGLAFYEVQSPADSFFERGTGEIEVGLDSIRCRRLVADNGSVVLRYHYYDHLIVHGARSLRAHPVPGDPVGFIEIVDPGPEVWIGSRHGLAGRRP
jgi:hypothetical protein